MSLICLKCESTGVVGSKIIRFGSFYRSSDSKLIQRYRCGSCRATFSSSSRSWHRYMKRRRKNRLLVHLLCSGVSQRRAAKILRLNRKTVVRKFLLASLEAEFELRVNNFVQAKAHTVEFDDLETFEHTKCKPLSVTLAVETKTRRILGLEVSSMPAKGLLARKARLKYGYRPDGRRRGREELFGRITHCIKKEGTIKSDSNPHYDASVRKFFPEAKYLQVLGKRGAITGQGELKKTRFDPLFSLNHTCAKFRADVNRLIRKTWCTTKRPSRLRAHMILYANYHNKSLSLAPANNIYRGQF